MSFAAQVTSETLHVVGDKCSREPDPLTVEPCTDRDQAAVLLDHSVACPVDLQRPAIILAVFGEVLHQQFVAVQPELVDGHRPDLWSSLRQLLGVVAHDLGPQRARQ